MLDERSTTEPHFQPDFTVVETVSDYVTQASLVATLQTKLDLNSQFCLGFLDTGIVSVHHHDELR